MGIKKIHEWEKAVVFLLNLDGWELEHCGILCNGNGRETCIVKKCFKTNWLL